MNEIVTESRHAQCEFCKIPKTARMTEYSANQQGPPQDILFPKVSRKARTAVARLKTSNNSKNIKQHEKTSKKNTRVVFHSARASVCSGVLVFRAHPCNPADSGRDHENKDSRVRVVTKLGAESTLDVSQVQMRQLVINL